MINPRSSETLAFVQQVKKGNPRLSTAKCLLIPLVSLYLQNPLLSTPALQVFCTA